MKIPIRFINDTVAVPVYITNKATDLNVYRRLAEVIITSYDTFAGQGIFLDRWCAEDGTCYTALAVPMYPLFY